MGESTVDRRRTDTVADLVAAVCPPVGGVSLVAGLLLLGIGLLTATPSTHHLVFGAVVAAGGAVLLLARRLRLPARSGGAGAAGAALAGTAAGLLAVRVSAGGMFAYAEHRGYPFAWLHRGATADTAEAARAAAQDAPATVEWVTLLADAAFWAYAGLLVAAAAAVARRAVRDRRAGRP
jgi:hypothetical protein